jgi:hypothetical protein
VLLSAAPPAPGATFVLGTTGYVAIYFFLQFCRPHDKRIAGLGTMQLLAVGVCVICVTVLIVMLI